MTTTCLHSFPDPHPAPLTQIGNCRHCGTSYQDAKTAMTAADEIQAAAKELQADQAGRETVLPSGAIISATLAKPLAKLLRETAALHEPGCPGKRPDGTNCGPPHGCDWCGDEDWPCNDIRNARAVARAILGTQEQP